MKHYFLKIFVILCCSTFFLYAGFYNKKTYMYKAPKRDNIYIKVEISVFDNDQEIIELMLDKKKLPLKEKDPQKNRGNIFLKLKPNKYTLNWSTKNKKYIWPRKLTHKKTFKVKEEDNWIYIRIEGSKIFIT